MERSQNCSMRTPTRRRLTAGLTASVAAGALLLAACGNKPPGQAQSGPGGSQVPVADTEAPTFTLQPSPLQKQLSATTPVAAQPPSDAQTRLSAAIDSYFQRMATRRFYVHVDKPMYQPGESVWLRVWELATPSLTSAGDGHGITVDLISPKGAVVLQKRIQVKGGVATNDFVLPDSVQGGEYIVRASSDKGGTVERAIIVSQYQPPRIKKKLEFLRKAYGPGDQVAAALALTRATGEPLAGQQITAIVTVDEREVARMPLRVSERGTGLVKFELPGAMARGDGLLTVLVADGGVTESIQKRIPIVLREMRVQLFPEGGDLVAGLPGRVYFMAKNLLDKPADIEGRVVDGAGRELGRFASVHNGMGHFELTPAADAAYFVEITRPVGIEQRIPVPAAKPSGCSLMSVDDPGNARADVRVAVWCAKPQTVIATAVLRERRIGDVAVDANPESPAVVSLPVPVGSQGAVRVTIMNGALQPLAERLIYRGRGRDLTVKIASDRASYAPRDEVALTVETRDLAGKPVAADLALAVVDDAVLAFADDKKAHMLARLYLESEMPGQEIEEPNFYLSDDARAAYAIDMLLGTQGWRRFEWQQVLAPPESTVVATTEAWEPEPEPEPEPEEDARPMVGEVEKQKDDAKPRRPMAKKPAPMEQPAKPRAADKQLAVAGKKKASKRKRARGPMRRERRAGGRAKADMADAELADEDWNGDGLIAGNRRNMWAWAPVRVFPVPNYQARYDGPRVDFRETIFWQPSVRTDKTGKATVKFYLSDAITSFRATAEGISAGGLPGRGEALIAAKLPVSLAVKMPLEVSRGDRIKLPVTLTNETERGYDVAVATQFGAAFKVGGGIPAKVALKPGERKSFFADLTVVGDGKDAGAGKALVAIDAANLRDEVARDIKVVPLGFPQEISIAGTVAGTVAGKENGKQSHKFNLAGALPGTIEASLSLYPSPLATMVKGTEAIIREPYGCFEQASSANYPNIMVLAYLEENDAADPAIVERAMGMLDRGYKKLTGYESPERGYEWFGGDPGHEALTAYGLMEFADMTKVYGDVDAGMVQRTAAWLKSRRDGKGGYERNKRALDSFGRASAEVTNGYITYALSEAGERDLTAELGYQKRMAKTTEDPYVMALAANVLVNLEPAAAGGALDRLQGMQKPDGSFAGADHSITRSGGQSLTIETTSLAALALIKAGRAGTEPVRKAIGWLNDNRDGHGGFGATQSTILSLRAMTAYASATRATQAGGVVTVMVNGKRAGELRFAEGHKDALVFDDIAGLLQRGDNQIELRLSSEISLPYSLAISYRSKMPASSEDTKVAVSTALAKAEVPMGEGVRMKVTVKNLSDEGIPMTLARIGLPGGLTFQNWQLDELKDKKLIDFYETREREVVVYFRSMAPNAVKDIDLDLIARVPGQYVAPASRAYLYYTDEFKHWAEPVRVTVR